MKALFLQCYSAENFLTIFDVPEGSYIDIPKFEKISPALLQQLQSGACSSDVHESEKEKSEPWQGKEVETNIQKQPFRGVL